MRRLLRHAREDLPPPFEWSHSAHACFPWGTSVTMISSSPRVRLLSFFFELLAVPVWLDGSQVDEVAIRPWAVKERVVLASVHHDALDVVEPYPLRHRWVLGLEELFDAYARVHLYANEDAREEHSEYGE